MRIVSVSRGRFTPKGRVVYREQVLLETWKEDPADGVHYMKQETVLASREVDVKDSEVGDRIRKVLRVS